MVATERSPRFADSDDALVRGGRRCAPEGRHGQSPGAAPGAAGRRSAEGRALPGATRKPVPDGAQPPNSPKRGAEEGSKERSSRLTDNRGGPELLTGMEVGLAHADGTVSERTLQSILHDGDEVEVAVALQRD